MKSNSTLGLESSCNRLLTKELQSLIDESDCFTFTKGRYLTGPLFLHSHMKVVFEEGAELVLTDREENFTKIRTRIAGIEMKGYPALLNIISCHDVSISGKGLLLGQGETWYIKYWGRDRKSGMRKEYDRKGLRWAVDYDCFRPKMVLIQDSFDISLSGIRIEDSPFWNVHVLYSHDVVLSGLTILSDCPYSPSTDGIDIDSSFDIEIRKCLVSTNDDGISLKSGRDEDGLRVNRITKDIFIHDCTFERGYGLSIGSELSGGIKGIKGERLSFIGSSCGFRIKSSKTRKGFVKNVILKDIRMEDVEYPFYCYLDWNPRYNQNSLPEDYRGEIPEYWKTLLKKVDDSLEDTYVENLSFEDIDVSYSKEDLPSCLFTFRGFVPDGIRHVLFSHLRAKVKERGTFVNTSDVRFQDCDIAVEEENHTTPGSFDNR